MAQALDAAAEGGVDAHRSRLQDEAADQIRIDLPGSLDLAAGGLLDLLQDAARFVVGQVVGGGQLDVEPALLGCQQPVEFARDLLDLADAALFRGQAQEVSDELIGFAEQVGDDPSLRLLIELGIAQDRTKLGDVANRGGEVAQLLMDLGKAAVLLRGVEQRARIRAVDGGYRSAPVRVVLPGREKQAWEGRREWG